MLVVASEVFTDGLRDLFGDPDAVEFNRTLDELLRLVTSQHRRRRGHVDTANSSPWGGGMRWARQALALWLPMIDAISGDETSNLAT